MSSQDPGTDAQTDEDFAVPVPRERGSSRKYLASFVAALVGVAAIGGAVWAWQSFMDQGAQPAEALPANTLAYAALDLDPPGGQKVAAFNALRKFPSIKKELGLDSADDVQKSVVDELTADSGCNLSYATLKPWLGDRMAAAVVPLKKPEPVAVLQVADAEKAKASLIKKSADCDFGFALRDGWAIVARNTAVAEEVSKETTAGSLDKHGDYKRLTGAAGDPGLVTLYAAPEAGKALLDAIDDDPFSAFFILQGVNTVMDPVTSFVSSFGLLAFAVPSGDYLSGEDEASAYEPKLTEAQKKQEASIESRYQHYEELTPEEQKALDQESEKFYTELFKDQEPLPGEDGDPEFSDNYQDFAPKVGPEVRKSLQSFTGLGGIGRIADGAVEVEIVGDELNGTSAAMYGGDKAEDLVSNLPKDSAITFGASLADGWVDALFNQISNTFSYGEDNEADAIKSFEKGTGLSVPEDLEALGGDGAAIVAGPSFSPDAIFEDPTDADVAARLTGDPDKIEAALDKLRTHLGEKTTKLLSKRVGDDIVVSANADYLDDLTKDGDLRDSDAFDQVVKNAGDAASVFYINFDAGDWLVKQTSGEDREDAKPLHALGMSITKSDGQQHLRFRLSFD